uniref:Uncharacterized protein n=1 Tax=Arundo donax TaxID=35708 RepID=A0A0A9BJN5_ARUDO
MRHQGQEDEFLVQLILFYWIRNHTEFES